MKVFIRADASITIGTGHLTRCLTLAGALNKRGAKIGFICRELPGNLNIIVEKHDFKVYQLPCDDHPRIDWKSDADRTCEILQKAQGVDWLIIDNYDLDKRWEELVRPFVKRIMVIDDLANRPHDCDLLLDQNLYSDMEKRYWGLVDPRCQKLLGPQFALLREEFIEVRKNLRIRDGIIRRILIFFGGSDPSNETAKALAALAMVNRADIVVDVTVGSVNPYKKEIEKICSGLPNTTFYCQVDNIAQLMAAADLAIGAGGSATWERCFLGLPSITVIIAQNQVEGTESLAEYGAIHNIGWSYKVSKEILSKAIQDAIDKPETVLQMGIRSMNLMNGCRDINGGAVLNAILGAAYAVP